MATQDEVTLAQYDEACRQIGLAGVALRRCTPDEAAEHWLPRLTQQTAIVFSYVGSNMTARHVPRFHETTVALQRAKDVTPAPSAGTLPSTPTTQEE